ncbi:MAG TPA: hypothetical protein VK550_06140 [Polyangiaceae bacterium]|nr:hypothetical protein [Polyangiaceae bacterium]
MPFTGQEPREPPRSDRDDGYTDLLWQTRGLQREQQQAREAWFSALPLDHKEELLFELEILLKGLACFSNPRNHPGPPRRAPVVAIDFGSHLAYWRDVVTRVVYLARLLLGSRDRSFVFQRYLETVLPEDAARTKLAREGMSQDTPEESLFALRHALTQSLEVADGLLRTPRVPYRLFYALLSIAQREIQRNTYFNPLTALEFRPEFDRIASTEVLELIANVPGRGAHRLVALTFLSIFRMLRYVRLIAGWAERPAENKRQLAGRIYLVLAVLRSDARALSGYLRKRTGALLAEGFEEDLLTTLAPDLAARHDALLSLGHRLIGIKASLEGIAASVRIEMRRSFEHDLPAPDGGFSDEEIRLRFRRATSELRPALENKILFLGKALGVRLRENGVFDSEAAKRETSERLRRDVWMFAQIVRAFASKAEHAKGGEDRWEAAAGFAFVREFLAYFQALGYPLLRASDYPRVDAFMAAMSGLEDADLLDPRRIEQAIIESRAFYDFLIVLFDEIGKRDELKGVAFDRRNAAASLKLYLGD